MLVLLVGFCVQGLSPNASAQLPATPMLLVAQAQLKDPLFRKSVVLVTRHGRSVPIGIILNHPLDVAAPDTGGDLGKPAFLGGPVSPQSVVYLFQAEGGVASNLLALGDDLYLGFGQSLLDDLSHRQAAPTRLRVFNGFSAWAPGQLENEIARVDWLLVPFDADILFRADVSNMWQDLVSTVDDRAI